MKTPEYKSWFRKKEGMNSVQKDDDNKEERKEVIKRKYVMSKQEIAQNEILEAIFKKFDTDGSGGLDIGELKELFEQNKIILTKETVEELFNASEFTLTKFKQMIDSEEDLNRFKAVIEREKDNILNAMGSVSGHDGSTFNGSML